MEEEIGLRSRMKKLEKVRQTALPENFQLLKDHLQDVKDRWSTRTRINHMTVLLPFTE
jgi:predicted nuclease with TOPRIM domain